MQAQRPKTPARLTHRIVASLALLSALGACGYKGPLYPPPPPPDASLTAPPTSGPPPDTDAPQAAPVH